VPSPVESDEEDIVSRCKIGAGGWVWERQVIPGIYRDSVAFPVPKYMGKC